MLTLLAHYVNEDSAARRMGVLAPWVDNESAEWRMAVLAHWHNVELAVGLMVAPRWQDFKSGSGLPEVLAHRRDNQLAAELF